MDLRRMGGECLVLGPEGAGKTLLIRKLEEYCKGKREVDENVPGETTSTSYVSLASKPMHHTVPTVGINLAQIHLAKGIACNLRESGGQMAPLWHNQYKECTMIIYVIDSSNQVQVSASTILLLDLLSSKHLTKTPVLIFFNKTDSPLGLGLAEYKNVMRLDEIVSHASQAVTVVEGSCWTGEGVGTVMQWLLNQCT